MSENKGYVHPEALVDADWVIAHRSDPKVRIIEVDVTTNSYNEGHIPGAVAFDWQKELQDQIVRAPISKTALEELLSSVGVDNDTTIILYGDNNNWFAAWALWILKYYGHDDVRLLDGSRVKWLADERPITTEIPSYSRTVYLTQSPNAEIRALRDLVLAELGQKEVALVDVRSPGEYSGELLAPAHLPQEGAQRGGHIPGARNIPWAKAVDPATGAFLPLDELRSLYQERGLTPDKEVIAYCRIGERSAHTWFVLHELLGYQRVKNYDGSWTECGSLVGVPVEKG